MVLYRTIFTEKGRVLNMAPFYSTLVQLYFSFSQIKVGIKSTNIVSTNTQPAKSAHCPEHMSVILLHFACYMEGITLAVLSHSAESEDISDDDED